MMSVVRRVACALSGGVDSAVAALLLKRNGFDVVGVYMVNWDQVEEGVNDCPRTKDEADARKVCVRLGIEFHVVDFTREYWNDVFMNMLENYRRGLTVVSDVMCNRIVKFDHLHRYAFQKLCVDAVATGHFARTNLGDFLERRSMTNVARLLMSADPLKDQTYFLSTLTQKQLRRSMFPVGSMTKPQVRQLAAGANLTEVLNKPESMGICFIGKRKSFDSFLDQYIEPVSGLIRNVDTGRVIGEHSGIHHFTLGKRIRLPPEVIQSPLGFFVASTDFASQTVWACEGSLHPLLFATEFVVSEPEWIAESPLMKSESVLVDFRCQRTHPAFECVLSRLENGFLKVVPKNPIRAAAPGQTCVFYLSDECLGSGRIENVITTLAQR